MTIKIVHHFLKSGYEFICRNEQLTSSPHSTRGDALHEKLVSLSMYISFPLLKISALIQKATS